MHPENQQQGADQPPFDIPGGWSERTVEFNGRELRLSIPADADAFLDAGLNGDLTSATDDTPTWAYLWPASEAMAAVVPSLLERFLEHDTVWELGCGIGLVGLAALQSGRKVTFTDYEPAAVELARHNAVRNGFDESNGLVLDWNRPLDVEVPILLACDVLYETKNHAPVLKLISDILAPAGVCWLGDPGRINAAQFVKLCRESLDEHGLQFRILDAGGAPQPTPSPAV